MILWRGSPHTEKADHPLSGLWYNVPMITREQSLELVADALREIGYEAKAHVDRTCDGISVAWKGKKLEYLYFVDHFSHADTSNPDSTGKVTVVILEVGGWDISTTVNIKPTGKVQLESIPEYLEEIRNA